jgi:hypothetical protein
LQPFSITPKKQVEKRFNSTKVVFKKNTQQYQQGSGLKVLWLCPTLYMLFSVENPIFW